MRILCVDIEGAPAAAIAERLHGEVELCAGCDLTAQLEEAGRREQPWDAILLGGEALEGLPNLRSLRRDTMASTWLLLGDDAERALHAGIDAVLDSDAESELVAEEAWRAIRARHDALRWPKSFIERRVAVATPWASLTDPVVAAGFKVTLARDAGLLTALRRVAHHAVVLHAGACQSSIVELVTAIHAYDPALGVAAVVSSDQEVVAARAAGAVAVRVAPVEESALVELAELAWGAWLRAQPTAPSGVVVRTRGALGPLGAVLAARERAVEREAGADAPVVLVVSESEAWTVDDEVAILVTERDPPSLAAPFVAALAPTAGRAEVAAALRVAATVAARERTITALGRRLHEVDARRVELLKQLADAQLELDNLATLDPLTETFNRRGMEDALSRELELARRAGGTVAGCLVELDVGERVYERFGLGGGDALVRTMAERLKRELRLTDSIGRIGDDAFLLLLPQTRIAEAALVSERAAEAATALPLLIGDEEVKVAVTTGVAVLPWDVTDLDDTLTLLRAAVERRRVNTGTSDRPRDTLIEQLGGDTPDMATLDELMGRLLRGEGLVAVAQPIVRVSDEVVVGYEMLARGREGLYEAPQRLLSLARHRGKLTEVDLRCLETCLSEAARLASHLLVSVNLFPTTLLDMSLPDIVARFSEVPDARLCLELSEEQFVGDPRQLLDRITALRSAGVRLAIDDVGKGRGTLDSVMLLEPDVVKIDKELITGASRDTRKERLLRRLVMLATTLGCEVVGEGVEKAEDLELLRELEVPFAQGFLWAEPVDLDSIPPGDSSPSRPRDSDAFQDAD